MRIVYERVDSDDEGLIQSIEEREGMYGRL